jgi:ribosomal protein L11 methyltransferase
MVRTPPEHSEEVGAALIDHGSVGIWERAPGVLTAYFSDDRPPQDVHRDLEVLIGSHCESLIIGFGVVQDEDWAAAWRASLSPLRITPRLTIVPSWTPYQPSQGEHVIVLDPGMAFGSGHHATTRACLAFLDARLAERSSATVLDLGTGSGIVAIAAARLGAFRVVACDIDPGAVEVARANVARNGVSHVVSVVDDAWTRGPYDVVVANLTAEPILDLMPHIASALSPSGDCILSGILADREDEVLDALRAHGLRVRDRLQDDGVPSDGNYAWVTLVAARPPRVDSHAASLL